MSSKKKLMKQQKQQKEMKKQITSSGGFPTKILLFLTFSILGGVIYSDVQTNGSWKESNTAHLLEKYHVCEYSHKVLNKTSECIKWMNSKIDAQFPGYEKKLHEIWEPYSEMLSDVGVMSLNLLNNARVGFVDIVSNLADKIEKQAPGLLEQTKENLSWAFSTTADYIKKGVEYLRDEVFVGKLAPENVGKVLMESLNTTQQKMNEFYIWASEKIRNAIK